MQFIKHYSVVRHITQPSVSHYKHHTTVCIQFLNVSWSRPVSNFVCHHFSFHCRHLNSTSIERYPPNLSNHLKIEISIIYRTQFWGMTYQSILLWVVPGTPPHHITGWNFVWVFFGIDHSAISYTNFFLWQLEI